MDALSHLKGALSDRYEIEREIGAGGMATVYLAHDLRHDRPVALKLLNPELGAVLGEERFLAEIRVTANLQHPNLLPLFDSGATDGLLYYVMPFVDGETLRSRLTREKQLPVDEAVRMAVAIANALHYAHAHGVIHRDLKPENVLLQAGQPVIADFGIALAVSKAGGSRITQTGLSLGTPQYMSPEQATGDRVIDGRSDIYSLGAVAYEMLTGEPPHTGSTAQAIIARMLTDKPRPMRSTRSAIPEHVEFAVQHALEKLPADRFSTAHEFAESLLGHATAGTTGLFAAAQAAQHRRATAGWKSRLLDPVALALGVIAVGAVSFAFVNKPAPRAPEHTIRFVLATPDSLRPIDNFPWPAAISRDGRVVVYTALGESGAMLYAVRTDQLEARPIPGTTNSGQPHFSPNGEWVAFEADGKLRKVKLDGSAPITITAAGSYNGADWTTRDEIIVGSEADKRGLSSVSAAGGDLVEFAKPDSSKGETDYLWPIATPDGKTAVFAIWTGALSSSQLATVPIDGGDIVPLDIKGIRPLAVIGRTLVYVQVDGAVMAIRLDRSLRHADGKPVPVHDPVSVVASNNGNSGVFISPDGAMVSSRGGTRSTLAWVSPDGSTQPIGRISRRYFSPRISPDGQRIAVVVRDQDKSDVWIYDLGTGTFSQLSSVAAAASPVWSPDGTKVFYTGIGEKSRSAIYSQEADGGTGAKLVTELNGLGATLAIAPDARSIVYVTYFNGSWELYRIRLDSIGPGTAFLTSRANETGPAFSPDGRWIALSSDQTGRDEVYVRSYPETSARVQISAEGGTQAAWSSDGKSIYYRAGTVMMAARLSVTPTLRVLSRDTVVKSMSQFVRGGGITRSNDIARDGRILGLLTNKDDYQLVVVPNWRVELEQRLAAAKH